MSDLLEIIASYDWRFTIGWGLLWFGIGVVLTAVCWGVHEARATVRAMQDLFGQEGVGHVVEIHKVHNPEDPQCWYNHAHCLCGESSLMYLKSDPTAPGLMERWSAEHIDSLMESAGR